MKKNLVLLSMILLAASMPAHSFDYKEKLEDYKGKLEVYIEKIRPHIVNVIGKEWTDKILGAEEDKIILPAIPKITDRATSTKEVKTNKKDVQIPEDKKKVFDYRYVRELYQATRKSKGNDDELAKWMNVLTQGGTREGVYRALVLDETYGGLENYDDPVNDSEIQFTVEYLSKYIAQSLKKDSISNFNFYSLKRLVVEKTLEVMDALAAKSAEDLYSWYAVFSSEMATKYREAFEGKMRLESSKLKHRNWAKAVPDQHIKSEVIIKLHTIYNFLHS